MVNSFIERAPRRDERPRPAHLIAVNNLLPNTHCRQNVASGAASRRNAGRFVTQFSLAQTVLTISTESRNYGDVLIWTSHRDTETQRRSTQAACTAGRAVRRALQRVVLCVFVSLWPNMSSYFFSVRPTGIPFAQHVNPPFQD